MTILRHAATAQSGRVLIDGVRQQTTLTELRNRSHGSKLALTFVHTAPDVAYDFYQDRLGHELSIEEFLRVREAPVEREATRMIIDCDAVLYNWTGQVGYRSAIHAMMHEIGLED